MTFPKTLDLSSLQDAIAQLKTSLEYYYSEISQKDPVLKKLLIAATIQAFEFTYELSIKFLKRFLEISEASAETIDLMSFPELIRTACEKNLLLNDWAKWKLYREKRNITSHTYDTRKAQEVMKIIPEFLQEADYLLKNLKQRLSQAL